MIPKNSCTQKTRSRLLKTGKNNKNGCIEWMHCKDKDGYGHTTFVKDGIKKTWKVHRLMYYLVYGEIPHGMIICHSCDNPSCFNPLHLFLGTHLENAIDRSKKGRSRDQRGEKNYASTLSAQKVIEIRSMATSGLSQMKIGKIFSVSQTCIGKILRRKLWKHI